MMLCNRLSMLELSPTVEALCAQSKRPTLMSNFDAITENIQEEHLCMSLQCSVHKERRYN